MKKSGSIDKVKGLRKMKEIMNRYRMDEFFIYELSEQDLKTKFIVPMLQALNWDIYDSQEVREQKNFFGLLPDFMLTDKHGQIILVEVKPPYAHGQLKKDRMKYRNNTNVRKEARVILLTTFKDTEIYTLGRVKGQRIVKVSCLQYISEFDKLWAYLSNSEVGFKTRTYEKALAPRG